MILNTRYLLCALFISVIMLSAGQAQAARSKEQPAAETTLEVKAKLDSFAKDYVSRANATIKPNRSQASVKKVKGQYVATFREVDLDTMTTEIYPSQAPGCSYVGHIVYLEKEYECIGKTRLTAQKGDFKQMRARRVRELFRYNQGKWCY